MDRNTKILLGTAILGGVFLHTMTRSQTEITVDMIKMIGTTVGVGLLIDAGENVQESKDRVAMEFDKVFLEVEGLTRWP